MNWRAPWLRSRVSLGLLSLWDSMSLLASYNAVYIVKIGKWAGLNPALILAIIIWVVASYLSGRYSINPDRAESDTAKTVLGLTTAGVAILGVFVGHTWLFGVTNADTRLRGFLLPVVCLTALSSYCFQLVVRREKDYRWIFICGEREKSIIELEKRRFPASVSFADEYSVGRLMDVATHQTVRGRETILVIGKDIFEEESRWWELLKLKERGVRIESVINWCEDTLQKIPPELMSNEWIVNAEGFKLRPGTKTWRIKRMGDVLGSLILAVILCPIFLVACLAVKLEDGGPVFYSQIRTGLYGMPFRIYKLRSMVENAEKDGLRWASRRDSRITRVGKLIRKFRLDEIPQLINVLNGDLSLIGPRPERPEIENDLVGLLPHYRVRQWIRPGLSGWAQVCCPYGASVQDSREKLSYDLYYLRNVSIFLDLLIVIKTIKLVLLGTGAKPTEEGIVT